VLADAGVRAEAVLRGKGGAGVGGVGGCGIVAASRAIADLKLMMNCTALFMSFKS